MEIELSDDQQKCYKDIMNWILAFEHPEYSVQKQDLLTFGGPAGSGKSTLIGKIRNDLKNYNIAFCSYTGKAAAILRSKLKLFNGHIRSSDYCGTIHSLIYEPILDPQTKEVIGWQKVKDLSFNLIIIDESSMVGEDIFGDLASFGIPILAVGDNYQLPPIEGEMNLMRHPDIRLEKIHRHAENSPIIKISMLAREEGFIPHGNYGDCVRKVNPSSGSITKFIENSSDFSDTAIICGFNKTRINLNQKVRAWFNYKDKYPQVGERIICLKNNKDARHCPIYNGVIGTVKDIIDNYNFLKVEVAIDGEAEYYKGKICPTTFNNEKPDFVHSFIEEIIEDRHDYDVDRFATTRSTRRRVSETRKKYLDHFDFGYCLTVHKSQGSEWQRVMLIEQPCKFWSGDLWNKWLYTAVTRAKSELLIVSY